MTFHRRRFLQLAAAPPRSPPLPRAARAQSYPTRPIRLVLRYPAGGATDLMSRIMGPWLTERLGQPVVIENQPGGGTNIATQAVVNSPPDGYTLLFIAAIDPINADALRIAAVQLPARHHAGRGRWRPADGDGREPVGAGQDRRRVHRLRQGQSRQDQHRLVRHRHDSAIWRSSCSRCTAGVDVRARALPRRRADGDRPDRRAGAGRDRRPAELAAAHQSGALRALAVTARRAPPSYPTCRPSARPIPGFEVERLDRHRRSRRHAERDHRDAQPRDQRRPFRPAHRRAPRRCRRPADPHDARANSVRAGCAIPTSGGRW